MAKGRRDRTHRDNEVIAKKLKLTYEESDLPTMRATNFVVHRSGIDEFLLLLYEAREPIIVGTEEERKAALDNVESVPAKCVGRFYVRGQVLSDFQRILNQFVPQHVRPDTNPEESNDQREMGGSRR